MNKILHSVLLLSFACRPEAQRIQAQAPQQLTPFDVDGDGDLDLLFIEPDGLSSSTQNGGVFSSPSSVSSGAVSSLILEDLDGDGASEPIFASAELGVSTFAGSPPQIVSLGVDATTVLDMAVADANDDGLPDLILLRALGAEQSLEVVAQQADGSFVPSTTTTLAGGIQTLAAGDLDRDGFTDVVGANEFGLLILVNNTVDGFTPNQLSFPTPTSVEIVDINNDNGLDMILFNESLVAPSSLLLRNDGVGVFTQEDLFLSGLPLLRGTITDVNGDGSPDIASQDCRRGLVEGVVPQRKILFATNSESGVFSLSDKVSIPDTQISELRVNDLNGDGQVDIFYVSTGSFDIVIRL